MRKLWFSLFFLFSITLIQAQPKNDEWLSKLLYTKGTPLLRHVLDNKDSFQYQIIYTRIDRDAKNRPHFTNYYVNVDRNRYFNPASTVKLPTALIALEKLNELRNKGIDKNTAMLTDSSFTGQTTVVIDTSAENGLPSIAHYIKKIFLISDNDAYNRLYEFDGQQTLNEKLWKKGYKDIRITRRFVPMSEEENRHTNAIRFMNDGTLLYNQPAAYSSISFDTSKKILIGKGHWNFKDSLINAPMDFTKHNNLPLEDLQQILQSVMFPSSVPERQRFHLSNDDYRFLYQYMSAYPSESHYPNYDTTEYFDSYTKFYFKANKQKIPSSIRIYNKTGWSYGFLTDASYIVDYKNHIEFMLSAVIYTNADGILNDNKYEYETVGYPFFHDIYEIIYDLEQQRAKLKSTRGHQIKKNNYTTFSSAIGPEYSR